MRTSTPTPDPAGLAFLPAALEVIETPPNPLGRRLIWSVCGLAAVALAWSWFGHVDVVAVAPGRIIPSDRVKLVQPFETAVVRSLHVTEGQRVAAGDLLVELDATDATADAERLAHDQVVALTDAARLRAALAAADAPGADPLALLALPEAAAPALLATQSALLAAQVGEHRARLGAIDRQIAQRRAEIRTLRTTAARYEATVPLIRERERARAHLADQGHGSRLTALEIRQSLVEAEYELAAARAREGEVAEALAALEAQRAQAEAEFRRTLHADRATAEQRAAGLAQELRKAEQRRGLHRLVAPVDGTVQQLAIATVGGVVTPAQTLMVVVPRDAVLEVEAQVENKDIGFVAEGQRVAVKVDTYLFTRFGLLDGTVRHVSADAATGETRPDGTRAETARPGPPTYPVRVTLARTTLRAEGRDLPLGPGMTVTAEITIDRRRILAFFLDPIAKRADEALKER